MISYHQIFLFSAFLAISLTYGCKLNPSVHHFKIGGKYDAMVINDGFVVIENNYFDVPDDVVRDAYETIHRAIDPLFWSENVVLVDAPAGRVLIDTGAFNTGMDEFRLGGNLIPNLLSAGVQPDSIDYVLLTHGHADHVAGLLTKDGSRRFRNAQIFIPRLEHQYWMDDSLITPDSPSSTISFQRIYKNVIKAYEGKYNLVDNFKSPVPGFVYTYRPGHTPGHAIIDIRLGGERIAVIGDVWFSYPDQVRHREWIQPFETNGTQSYFTRTKVLSDLVNTGDKVIAYHEDFPGIGYIIKTELGFDWVNARTGTLGNVRKVCV